MSKICTKCGIEKPLSNFGKNKAIKDGKTVWCLQCKREYAKWFRSTPSGVYQQIKSRTNFRRNNPDRYNTYHPLKISKKDFLEWYKNEPKICTYCGLPENKLDQVRDVYNDHKSKRLTVDCKNNELGYIKGNLVLACKRCNTMKSDFLTYEEMCEIGQKYIKPKWEEKLKITS